MIGITLSKRQDAKSVQYIVCWECIYHLVLYLEVAFKLHGKYTHILAVVMHFQ